MGGKIIKRVLSFPPEKKCQPHEKEKEKSVFFIYFNFFVISQKKSKKFFLLNAGLIQNAHARASHTARQTG
jgi:hypothetical protein